MAPCRRSDSAAVSQDGIGDVVQVSRTCVVKAARMRAERPSVARCHDPEELFNSRLDTHLPSRLRLLIVLASVPCDAAAPMSTSTVLSCGWRSVDVDAAASVHRAATAADYVSSVYWCCVRAMVIAPVSTCCAQRCLRRRSSVRRSWMHLLARPPCCDEAGGEWSWMRLWHSSVQPVDWAFRRSLLSTPVSL